MLLLSWDLVECPDYASRLLQSLQNRSYNYSKYHLFAQNVCNEFALH